MSTQIDHDNSAFSDASVAPLWERTAPPNAGRGPSPQLWRYQDVRPLLDLVADDVPIEVAERRVLLMVNDSLTREESTSRTLQANLQMVRPGEFAPAHRHTMTAVRFGIEGAGVITTVDGVSVTIEPGDLVLTPSMSWHEHRHVDSAPVVWLDVLDRPLAEALGQVVFERATSDDGTVDRDARDEDPDGRSLDATHLVAPGRTPNRSLRFPWQRTSDALDRVAEANPDHATHGTTLEYRNPWTGEPVAKTMTVRAHRLEMTHSEPFAPTTATRIFHVRSGTGRAQIGELTTTWEPGDTFVVPPRAEASVTPTGDSAELVSFDDSPALDTLALLW